MPLQGWVNPSLTACRWCVTPQGRVTAESSARARASMHNVVTFLFFLRSFPLQLSSALLFDAVYAVAAAVQELNRSQSVGAMQLSCKSSNIWAHGTSLMNYLRMVSLFSSAGAGGGGWK